MQNKPKMNLIGEDSNIFCIMARARRLLAGAGMEDNVGEMVRRVEASGNYYAALQIISEYDETEIKV